MSAGKMLHTGNFLHTDFKKLEGTLDMFKFDYESQHNIVQFVKLSLNLLGLSAF